MVNHIKGRLFNVFRLKDEDELCFLYFDDTGFVSHSEVDLQTILDRFAAASAFWTPCQC